MRRWMVLLLLLLGAAGCRASLPSPPGLRIAVRAEVRASVEIRPAAVALEGAAVVEFFGIPLDDA